MKITIETRNTPGSVAGGCLNDTKQTPKVWVSIDEMPKISMGKMIDLKLAIQHVQDIMENLHVEGSIEKPKSDVIQHPMVINLERLIDRIELVAPPIDPDANPAIYAKFLSDLSAHMPGQIATQFQAVLETALKNSKKCPQCMAEVTP